MGVTPITFDVSQSVGESLSYVIEFGDGDFTQMSSSSATHASMREGSLTAAVTVTDRFGRFAVASQHFGPVERLGVQRYNYDPAWHNSIWNAAANRFEIRSLRIGTHDGLTLSGSYRHPEGWWSPFSATLDGRGGIELTLIGGGLTLRGRVRRCTGYPYYACFQLTAQGGSADGMTLDFRFDDGYAVEHVSETMERLDGSETRFRMLKS